MHSDCVVPGGERAQDKEKDCVGCCWLLMALLFAVGVMNLLWVALIAVYVLLEKVSPGGSWLSRAVGVLLIGWGIRVLIVMM
ncbi:MAG TPA: DUF2182 domain-containing protein [Candidatus Acidoferrum sp.]|nr:DUF2182 domain-containing protein [Candidatus Methylomirabilis sp.]HWU38712.1 DUF2182 domain-containing protein [Candidatus Acidoferrum sp.]